MTREEFDIYLEKFNARDYNGFLDYYTEPFELIHAGGRFTTREEVLKSYAFLHRYLKETIIVDHFVSDGKMIAMEARVRIEGIVDLTPEILAASDYPGFKPLKAGQVVEIPQFIHYHLVNGKFSKVECRE
jgi:hypothetical protein